MKATVEIETPMLCEGEQLTRDEFMDRREKLPELAFAELIGCTVHVRNFPLSLDHGDGGFSVSMWLGAYASSTPGCVGSNDSTWYMRDDAPQPECSLRILPDYGGQSSIFVRNGRRFGVGAPELVAEVSLATVSYDVSVKKELYRKAGVREFICVQPEKKKIVWFRLSGNDYVDVKAKSGIFRSDVFPGLWLDGKALLAGDSSRILAVLNAGLKTPEHASFAAQLARRKREGA